MGVIGEMELPPPAIQKKASYTIREARYDFNEATIPAKLKKYLLAEVDEKWCTLPLAGYCFMTGIMCVWIFVLHRVLDQGFS